MPNWVCFVKFTQVGLRLCSASIERRLGTHARRDLREQPLVRLSICAAMTAGPPAAGSPTHLLARRAQWGRLLLGRGLKQTAGQRYKRPRSSRRARRGPAIARQTPMLQQRLKDRIALVTGSSSGIGRGIAIAFAREGANVIINYPDESQTENARAAIAEIERLGRCALPVRADVSLENEARSLVDATMNAFQRIDILVNNASIASAAPVERMPLEMWDRMMAVNLRSVFLCTHFVLPIMYRQNYGKIISTASLAPMMRLSSH
jgi:short chain dehydrogenase